MKPLAITRCDVRRVGLFVALASLTLVLPRVCLADSVTASKEAPSPALIEAGKTIWTQGGGGDVAACVDCHGTNGQGSPSNDFPALGTQSARYIQEQLNAFTRGSRSNDIMAPIAKGMTPAQIAQVAAYASQLAGSSVDEQPSVAAAGGEQLVQRGRILYQYGKMLSPTQFVPSCRLCHGDNAQGGGDQFPPLAGQPAGYIAQQLEAWQGGHRTNDPNGLMMSIAVRLDADDIKAVSAYLASIAHVRNPIWPYKPRKAVP